MIGKYQDKAMGQLTWVRSFDARSDETGTWDPCRVLEIIVGGSGSKKPAIASILSHDEPMYWCNGNHMLETRRKPATTPNASLT